MAEEPRYLEPFRQRDFKISCAAVTFVMLLLMMCLFAGLLLRFRGDDNDGAGDNRFVERAASTLTTQDPRTAVGMSTSPTPTQFLVNSTPPPTPTALVLAPGGVPAFNPGAISTPAPAPVDPFVPPPPVVVPVEPAPVMPVQPLPPVIPTLPPPFVMPTYPPPPVLPTDPPPPPVIPTVPPPPPVIPTEPPPPEEAPSDDLNQDSNEDFQILLASRGSDSLFLVNQTEDRSLPLAPLRLGDGEGAVEGSEWDVERLKPGDCVTVWKAGDNPKAPKVDCDRVGSKLKRKGSERFWRSDFNVYYHDALIGKCTKNKCSFTIPN